jgi:hypothetical protein
MQELFFLKQAPDGDGSTGRRTGRYRGFLVASILLAAHALSVAASAQSATPLKPNVAAEVQKVPSAAHTQEEWRNAMSRTELPKKGCFTASYPKIAWLEVPCGVVTSGPHYPAQGTMQGNNNSFIALSTGSISRAVGSFDSVSVTGVTDSISHQTDTFSLQLNTNFFDVVPLCPVGSNCGWQQFVFGSFGCQDLTGNQQDCVYIEYWLRDRPSCPMGWNQISDDQGRTHCIVLSQGMLITPHQPITSIQGLRLTGQLQPNDNIVAAIFDAGGTMVAVSSDDFLDLIGNFVWQEAEFNVFGQDKASQALFDPGTTLVVRTQIEDRQFGNLMPSCHDFLGFTRESNNLHLIQPPTMIANTPLPSIVFQETNNNVTVLPDCAVSVGDTHLMTFDGLFYDFQATGEFLLAQPASDFVVQTRQVSGAPKWPNAAINKAVAVKMGKTSVAICLAPARLEIDGKLAHLDDGKSLALPGNVTLVRRGDTYFVGRPGGEVVRADVNDNEYIDVYVGRAPGVTVHGLLGNANGATGDDIAMQAGSVLTQPVAFTDLYGRYADSWRVPSNQSLLCPGQKIEHGKPGAPIYANNLTPSQYTFAQGVCSAAGVKDATLLDACILDVTVIGSNKAANAFVGLTPPVAVMRVEIAGVPPGGVQPPPGTGVTPLQVPK